MQEATSYVAAEMDEKELQKAGVQIDEFFVRCTYDGIRCPLNQMKSFTDMRYGNCFTFNWNGSYYAHRQGQNLGKDVSLLGTPCLYSMRSTVKLLINRQELWHLRCWFNRSFTVKFLPMAGRDTARVHQQPAGRAVGRN